MKALTCLCISFLFIFINDSSVVIEESIKSVKIECKAPEKLKAVEITSNSALLDWKGPLRNFYEVEWGENGFERGEGTQSNTNTRKLSLNGLSPDTPYDYYVRGNCGGTEFTEWVGPYTFVTDRDIKAQ
jgi:hypothetical protein